MRLLIGLTELQSMLEISAQTAAIKYEKPIREAQEFNLKPAIGAPLYVNLINQLGKEPVKLTVTVTVGTFAVNDLINGKAGSTVKATGKITAIAGSVYTVEPLTGDWRLAATIEISTNTATITATEFGKYFKLFYGDEYDDQNEYPVIYEGILPALIYWAGARFNSGIKENVSPIGMGIKTNQFQVPVEEDRVAQKVAELNSGAYSYFSNVKKYICDMNALEADTYPYQSKAKEAKSSGAKLTTIDRTKTRRY